MYRCNRAFDKSVKECMWILCQNCYDIRLEELEKQEASQRKKPKQDKGKKSWPRSSRGSGLNGVLDCCPRHEVDICSLELDENFSLVTKKHIEKLEKNYTYMDGNPGRNLVDFSFQKYAMIVKEESQWLMDWALKNQIDCAKMN